MMSGNVYVNAPASLSFKAFCKEISKCFNIQNLEFRESDHCAHGEYARGTSLGITIKLGHADDPDFLDYRFSVGFSFVPRAALGGNEFLDALEDYACRRLTLLGWSVARDPDMGKVGGRKILYSLIAGDVTTQTVNGVT